MVLKNLVHNDEKLYFYFPEFVVRVQKVHLDLINEGRKFLSYGEPEYVNYTDMKSRPGFIDQNSIAFYDVLFENKWYTYALGIIGVQKKVNEFKVNQLKYVEGQFAG